MAEEGGEAEERILEEAEQVALSLVMMITSLSLGRWIHRRHIHWLPEAAGFVIVGVLFGTCIHAVAYLRTQEEAAERNFFFNAELFNLILLPHIIFEAGYSLATTRFFNNIGAISTYAVVGTLLNAVFTWAVLMGLIWNDLIYPLTVVEAGALSALISAVDPVSTLTLFKVLEVHPELDNMLFGESVLNDAVSIILFRAVMQFAHRSFTPDELPWLIFDFCKISFGSFGIGCLLTVISALFMRQISRQANSPIVDAAVFWAFSYLAFLTAEIAQMSGIVSALFAGIFMKRYTAPNLCEQGRSLADGFLKIMATMSETYVFMLVGLATFAYLDKSCQAGLIIATLCCCLVGRALNIFGLSLLTNLCRSQHRIPFTHQVIMWFSGLRGAIAMTLAVQMPGPAGDVVISTTIIIVLITIFLLGGSTRRLMSVLKIEMGSAVLRNLQSKHQLIATEMTDAEDDTAHFRCSHDTDVATAELLEDVLTDDATCRHGLVRRVDRMLLQWLVQGANSTDNSDSNHSDDGGGAAPPADEAEEDGNTNRSTHVVDATAA